MNKYIFTCGDINGIGPEIIIKTLNAVCNNPYNKFFILIPNNVFINALRLTKPKFSFEIVNQIKKQTDKQVTVLNIGKPSQSIGIPTKTSGRIAFKSIEGSFNMLNSLIADAVITAPISKTAINKAGINFPGHTEMYANWSGVNNFVMMFLSKKINAALATIHNPLKRVSSLITLKRLSSQIEVIIKTMKIDLNKIDSKIAVLGLNPHAGEDGLIGDEEKKIMNPVIKQEKYKGILSGPFSSDAFFGNKNYKDYDCVFGMYHDQVLIPFKLLNFGNGVNYTAGLPIIRTSPDHGTAFNIAGKGIADPSSMIQAFKYSEIIVNNRNKNVRESR